MMENELKKNITKGVGKGNFGYGLYTKDKSGLDFTAATKKKLAKEREAFLKGQHKFGQFSNYFTEASKVVMFRMQLGNKLTEHPEQYPPEFHKELVDLDKKYMKGKDPIKGLNELPEGEIRRAYMDYKAFYLKVEDYKKNKNFNAMVDRFKDSLADPSKFIDENESALSNMIDNGKHKDKWAKVVDWVENNRAKCRVILAALAGLVVAINVWSKLKYGRNAVYVAFKKFSDWHVAKHTVDQATAGTPLSDLTNEIENDMANAQSLEDCEAVTDKLKELIQVIKQNQHFSNPMSKLFSLDYVEYEPKFFSVDFFVKYHNEIDFSLIEKRDEVLNSLRLVFKEMPKNAPVLDQTFMAIQYKFFKEKLGTYDIEALKPKVQDMSEAELEECNKSLRLLLKEIRTFNNDPKPQISNTRKLPDDDLNKAERLLRDIGKNAHKAIAPVGAGLGLMLTIKNLRGGKRR